MTIRTTVFALLLSLVVIGRAESQGATDLAAAWSRSLALEAAGDVTAARATIVQAFGEQPTDYAPTVRLAWLSLLLRESARAEALYRRARALPGALPEASEGLALALTQQGYRSLRRGDARRAREQWTEALALAPLQADARDGLALLGPPSVLAADVWGGFLSATNDTAMVRALYIGLPYRINPAVSVRGAYRRIFVPQNFDEQSIFGSQTEFYAGVSLERGIGAVELLGISLTNSVESQTGGALAARVGGRVGATMLVSGLHRPAGWNVQVAPQAFAWVTPFLALSGGIRATRDPDLSPTSALLGGSFRWRRVGVDVESHLGRERFAVGTGGPHVMSFNASTGSGTAVTASLVLGARHDRILFVQSQFESLRTPDGRSPNGRYSGTAIGMRWLSATSASETTR